MEPFNVDRMLTQIKKVYADKAVRSGFEDDSLYNDNLLTLTSDDAELFNKLNAIVGKTQKQKTPTKVTINVSDLTDEEYDQAARKLRKRGLMSAVKRKKKQWRNSKRLANNKKR